MDLRKLALEERRTLAQQLLQRKGGPAKEEKPEGEAAAETAEETSDGAPASGRTNGRAMLRPFKTPISTATCTEPVRRPCKQTAEPHSPIPSHIQRACELGSLPFPQLMRALIRDQNIITEMNRELGIHISSRHRKRQRN